MKKIYLLSVLFLIFSQTILKGQVLTNPVGHEFSIYSGVSFPQGEYAELDLGRKTVGRAMMGIFIDGSYTRYFDDETIGLNFTIGYNHNPVDEEFIIEYFTSPNSSITTEVSYADWEMCYFMPGLSIRKKGDNQIKLTVNAGLLQFTEAADIYTSYYNSSFTEEFKSEYQFTPNFAIKSGISMHYHITSKLYVQIRGGLLYSKTKRDVLYTQRRNESGIISETIESQIKTLNLLTLNAALGLVYNFSKK